MNTKAKTLTIRLPPWISEEEARRIIEEVEARLWGRVSIDEIRTKLGVREEDLVEEVEARVGDVEVLRRRDRERLS